MISFQPTPSQFFENPVAIRKRFSVALTAAAICGLACTLTLLEPQWLGFLVDEDSGDASREIFATVAVLFAACVVFLLVAWRSGGVPGAKWPGPSSSRTSRDPQACGRVVRLARADGVDRAAGHRRLRDLDRRPAGLPNARASF